MMVSLDRSSIWSSHAYHLAGDCFVCTTVAGMIPKQLYVPAEYDPAKRWILDRPSTVQDIVDFIVEYIYSDVRLRFPITTLLISDSYVV